MQPLEFHARAQLALPPSAVWRRLADLSLAHRYVPGILRTEITTAATEGVGASRRVYTSAIRYINETVTDWREGRGFTLRLHRDGGGAPAPFREAGFRYELEGLDAENTRITLRLDFTMRGGALGHWLARGLLAGAFQRRLDAIAASMKRFYEAAEAPQPPVS